MKKNIELENAVLTFISNTKEGKYSRIDGNLIETPRVTISRDEYLFEEDSKPVYFSITN